MAAKPPASVAFLQQTEDDADQATTYTYATQNFGVAEATRRIVVVFNWSVQNAARVVTSGTIGGIAATVHLSATTGPTVAQTDCGTAILSALVPSGTSGNIAIVANGAMSRSSIGVYRAVGEGVATPHATMNDIAMSAGVLTGTINIPGGGWVVGGACGNTTPGQAFTWAGVTGNYDSPSAEAAGVVYSGGHATNLPLEVGRTVSATLSGTPVRGALAAISWG